MALANVYQAQSLGDGISALLSALPPWFASTAGLGAAAAYWCTFKLRMKLARWRAAQRNAILNRLRPLHGTTSPDPEHQEEQDGHDAGIGADAATPSRASCNAAASPGTGGRSAGRQLSAVIALSSEDIDEFCLGLGLCPRRDEDLTACVVEMLQSPSPPDWPLDRCRGGEVRFVHGGRGYFFHPEARHVEDHVRRELEKRRRMERKELGLPVDDHSPPSSKSEVAGLGDPHSAGDTYNFFMTMLERFKAREMEKMERDVTESLRAGCLPPPSSRGPPPTHAGATGNVSRSGLPPSVPAGRSNKAPIASTFNSSS
jgi:hypothetical protein